jgi:hypothetical protein
LIVYIKLRKIKMQRMIWVSLSVLLTASFLTGCDKVANSAKNLQSDWVGLERTVELYSCMTGKLIKVYQGDVRINPEDTMGTSILVDGKKVNTNLCYVMAEVGVKEELIPGQSLK